MEELEKEIIKKYQKREKRKRPRVKISDRSVFKIKDLISKRHGS